MCGSYSAKLCELQFNVSHSEQLAICAVTRSRQIGVDIEFVRGIESIGALNAMPKPVPIWAGHLLLGDQNRNTWRLLRLKAICQFVRRSNPYPRK